MHETDDEIIGMIDVIRKLMFHMKDEYNSDDYNQYDNDYLEMHKDDIFFNPSERRLHVHDFIHEKLKFLERELDISRHAFTMNPDGFKSRLIVVREQFEYFEDEFYAMSRISELIGYDVLELSDDRLGEYVEGSLEQNRFIDELDRLKSYWKDYPEERTPYGPFWFVFECVKERIGCTELALILCGPSQKCTFDRVNDMVETMAEDDFFHYQIRGYYHYELFLYACDICEATQFRALHESGDGFLEHVLLGWIHRYLIGDDFNILERLTRPLHRGDNEKNYLMVRSSEAIESSGNRMSCFFLRLVYDRSYDLSELFTLSRGVFLPLLLEYIYHVRDTKEEFPFVVVWNQD